VDVAAQKFHSLFLLNFSRSFFSKTLRVLRIFSVPSKVISFALSTSHKV